MIRIRPWRALARVLYSTCLAAHDAAVSRHACVWTWITRESASAGLSLSRLMASCQRNVAFTRLNAQSRCRACQYRPNPFCLADQDASRRDLSGLSMNYSD